MAKFVVLPRVEGTQVGLALFLSLFLAPQTNRGEGGLRPGALSLTKPLLTLRLVILNGPGLTGFACSLFLLLVIHVWGHRPGLVFNSPLPAAGLGHCSLAFRTGVTYQIVRTHP